MTGVLLHHVLRRMETWFTDCFFILGVVPGVESIYLRWAGYPYRMILVSRLTLAPGRLDPMSIGVKLIRSG